MEVSHDEPRPYPKAKEPQHACHCGKAFIRIEHLRRHQLTHDQSTHVCHICGRSFTRNDLLQRHVRLHGSGSRLRRACDACRAKKKSCDRNDVTGDACSLCSTKNKKCTFTLAKTSNLVDNLQASENSHQESQAHVSAFVGSFEPSLTDSITTDKAPNDSKEPGIALTAMRFLHDTLTSPATDLTEGQLGDVEIQADLKTWFESCCQAFFKHLHHRWPVVHYTSFNMNTEPLHLSITIIISGCHLQEGNDEAKDLALKVHEALVGGFCEQIVGYALYLVLNQTKPLLDRAYLFYGLMISTFRNIGFFSSEGMAYQELTHFPGTFGPFVMAIREKWKRLVANTYKLDTFLAILRRQPPILHTAEIDVELTFRFCLWNTKTIDVLQRRYSEEPLDRQTYKMSQFLAPDAVLAPADLLVEDIELGLCGTLLQAWEICQVRHTARFDPLADNTGFNKLLTRLGTWKARLDTISTLLGQRIAGAGGTGLDSLVQAYLGKESQDDPEREQAALGRITSLLTDAALLHCFLLSTLLDWEPQSVEKFVGPDFCPAVKDMWETLFAAVGKRQIAA
ncbi:Fc.00g080190.m01.CDS01 [Cosmosporella sp. VM-42]